MESSVMKGRVRPQSDPVQCFAVESPTCQVQGKPKPHLRIKNCFMLYPRAGVDVVLACLCAWSCSAQCVHGSKEKMQSPSPHGKVLSAAISDGPLLPQSLGREESALNNANAEIKILDGD